MRRRERRRMACESSLGVEKCMCASGSPGCAMREREEDFCPQKSFKSSIVIIPAEETWGPIQNIRM